MKKLVLVVLFITSPAFAVSKPNSKLTPGVSNPVLTRDVICSPRFRTKHYRKVTQKMHRQVWKAYGMNWSKDHSCCEDDHLIPIELGGSNKNANRWPQPWSQAKQKDKVENYLHREVCSDHMTLQEAQQIITSDWFSVYKGIK